MGQQAVAFSLHLLILRDQAVSNRCGSKLEARGALWKHFLAWLDEEVSLPLQTSRVPDSAL